MEKKRNFNLLKPLQPPSTAWDRVYEWLIGKARVVILVTELIVATTFIFKVVADTTAKNKDKEIDRLTQELSFYVSDLEPKFRQLEFKSDKYIQIWNNASEYNDAVQEILSYIENESSEISMNIQNNIITVFGYEDLDSIKALENAVKSSQNFKDAIVNDLSLNQGEIEQNKGRYSFTVSIINIKRPQI